MDIQSNAVSGLNDARLSVLKNASNIASKNAMQGNLNIEKELIEMKQSEQQFSSVAKVLKSEDDLKGVLLDIKV